MRLISRRVEQLLGAADALDLDDPRAVGIGVERFGRVGQRLVDRADGAADGGNDVGDRLDGFNIAEKAEAFTATI